MTATSPLNADPPSGRTRLHVDATSNPEISCAGNLLQGADKDAPFAFRATSRDRLRRRPRHAIAPCRSARPPSTSDTVRRARPHGAVRARAFDRASTTRTRAKPRHIDAFSPCKGVDFRVSHVDHFVFAPHRPRTAPPRPRQPLTPIPSPQCPVPNPLPRPPLHPFFVNFSDSASVSEVLTLCAGAGGLVP